MTGFLEIYEAGGRTVFIDAGAVCGVSCPGMPETTASKDAPIELIVRGAGKRRVIGVSPLNLMAQIAWVRSQSRTSQSPLFVMFQDGREWDVEVRTRNAPQP